MLPCIQPFVLTFIHLFCSHLTTKQIIECSLIFDIELENERLTLNISFVEPLLYHLKNRMSVFLGQV